MEWPLKRSKLPFAQAPTGSLYYQAACTTPSDPTIVWGTDVPWPDYRRTRDIATYDVEAARQGREVRPYHSFDWSEAPVAISEFMLLLATTLGLDSSACPATSAIVFVVRKSRYVCRTAFHAVWAVQADWSLHSCFSPNRHPGLFRILSKGSTTSIKKTSTGRRARR